MLGKLLIFNLISYNTVCNTNTTTNANEIKALTRIESENIFQIISNISLFKTWDLYKRPLWFKFNWKYCYANFSNGIIVFKWCYVSECIRGRIHVCRTRKAPTGSKKPMNIWVQRILGNHETFRTQFGTMISCVQYVETTGT